MMRTQEGFTLIELVAVIVILGALAVVALPRFISLQEEAEQAAVEGVAGGISSAFAVNYAASLAADSASDYTTVNASGDDIQFGGSGDFDINDVMQSTISGYTVNSCDGFTDTAPGATNDCEIVSDEDSNATATFTAIATSN